MERRQFLQASALAGAAAVGGVGCGAGSMAVGAAGAPDLIDMDAFLARLDGALGFVAKDKPLAELVPEPAKLEWKDKDGNTRDGEAIFRKTLRAMLLVGAFKDLPEEQRLHPGMQERMWAAMPEMDEAVLGMTDMLESLAPAERVRLQRELKAHPEIGMKLGEELDREAARAGLSIGRRAQIRATAKQMTFRLENQSASLLIDEYVGKVKKVAARHGAKAELQRDVTVAASGAMIFGWQAQPAPVPGLQPAPPPMTPPAPGSAQPYPYPPPYPYPYPPRPQVVYRDTPEDARKTLRRGFRSKTGTKLLTIGGILFGVGAIFGIAGAIVVGNGDIAGAFMITAAAILGVAALVLLIIGVVFKAQAPEVEELPTE